jgi:Protein kinase domain
VFSAPDIPGHRVAGILGSGGFATVYRCLQLAVGREVAVKVDSRVLVTERDQRRFLREVTAAGRLSGHPNVIDVYDAGTLGDGRPYLVMELCLAGSLNEALQTHGPMSAAAVRDIGIRVADALAAAHAAGVLHRDIKPANILVNRYGMVGLSDFGLASIRAATGEQSATREALTPAYAAPECFRWEEPTVAADIYSLGATLYALLAGRPPRFPADGSSPGIPAIILMHDQPVPDVPGVPNAFMDLLRWCMAADPAQRPASAAALRDALTGLAGQPGTGNGRPAAAAVRPPASGGGQHPAAGNGQYAAASGARLPAAASGQHPAAGSAPPPAAAGTQPPAAAGTQPPARAAASGRHATRPPRSRPAGRIVAAVIGVALLLAAAAALGLRLLPHGASAAGPRPGTGAPSTPGVFGVPTVTTGCAAAAVRSASARCPLRPECWNGLVVNAGSASARSLPCAGAHVWETFAIAILPADVRTFDQNIVAANPSVRAVCSMPVLMRSRRGRARQIPARSWEIDVLPPDEAAFDSGARAYRCVAHLLTGPDPRTAQFGH